ncbi:MAG: hypothetical protein ACRDNF_25195 [Streptosporangiaceae bacterium]
MAVETAAGGGGTSGAVCLANGATSVSVLAPFSYDWIGGNIRGLSTLAGTLYGYVPEISAVTSALDSQVEGLVGAAKWTGPAASAFTNAFDEDATAAHALAALTEDAGEIIDALALALSKIESELEQAAAKAKSHGAPIEANGEPLQACIGGTTTAAKEAGLWLEWYQKYYSACISAANKVRTSAAGDLSNLPIPGVGKGGNWEGALVTIASGIDTVVGAGQGGAAALGSITTKASAAMRAGDSDGAALMSLLSHNSTWQKLGEFGRSDAVDLGGKYLLGAGAVLTGIGVYQQTHNLGEAATDAVGDTAIGWGTTWTGTEAGATIGSFVGPEGTLIGGGIGAIVGAGVGFIGSGDFNHLMGDIFG